MATHVSKGTCNLCGGTFSKGGMSKHLEACARERAPDQTTAAGRKPKKRKLLHLVVEGRYAPDYWLHLELPSNATLAELDGFLREIWLECCGHMSAFTIEGQMYSVSPSDWDERGMGATLNKVLSPGMKFFHEYDFGTTTELALRVVSEREGQIRGKGVQILARNAPPEIPCDSCGKPATQVCSECQWSDGGWLCDPCAAEHECGEDMLLPVVNSPRVGMCAYTGELE